MYTVRLDTLGIIRNSTCIAAIVSIHLPSFYGFLCIIKQGQWIWIGLFYLTMSDISAAIESFTFEREMLKSQPCPFLQL
jgi:hypothetical protein